MKALTRHQIAARLGADPLFLHPDTADHINSLLQAGMDFDSMQEQMVTLDRANDGAPYQLVGDGIAVIPVHGYLAHRVGFHVPGYMTGYDYITALADMAAADPDVRGVVLDVNSGGGEVAGAFEAAAVVRDLAEKKPVWAVVDSSAYSAAYLLSSAASKIVVPKAGGAGSIGVVTMHVDLSQALDKFGVKVTMLYAGKHKVDGNPYEPLGEEAKNRIETKLQASYNLFVSTVSDYRGMDSADVRATEAATYQAPEALSVGLVDAVMSPREALAAFQSELAGRPSRGGNAMSIDTDRAAPVESAENVETPAEASVDTGAVAAEARNEGAQAERARVRGIMACDEAEGRKELAEHLAYETDMSVDQAKAILGRAPKEKAEQDHAVRTPFEAAMAGTENPEVGAGAEASSEEEGPEANTNAILRDYAEATGLKLN